MCYKSQPFHIQLNKSTEGSALEAHFRVHNHTTAWMSKRDLNIDQNNMIHSRMGLENKSVEALFPWKDW